MEVKPKSSSSVMTNMLTQTNQQNQIIKQTKMCSYSPNLRHFKIFNDVFCCVCKNIEILKQSLSNILFKIDIKDLCSLSCFCVPLIRQLESINIRRHYYWK